jgi:hypothetical protein
MTIFEYLIDKFVGELVSPKPLFLSTFEGYKRLIVLPLGAISSILK